MGSTRFSSVEDQLDSLDESNATIRAVLESILRQFPKLEVKVSWNVPQIHRGGKYVFGIGVLE
jgi:uncharacterized protein